MTWRLNICYGITSRGTAFFLAAWMLVSCDIVQSQTIRDIGTDSRLSGNSETISPLQKSFDQPDPSDFEALLQSGIKAPTGGWDTWIWKAFKMRDIRKMRILLSHGVRPSSPARPGSSMVEIAARTGQTGLVKLLLDYGCPPGQALWIACDRGDSQLVEVLLASGASPTSTRFPSKDTPLSTVIRLRHDAVALKLLEYGADPKLAIPEGQSTLHFAVAMGCPLTVKHLLDAGGNPNAPFSQPVSPAFFRLFRPGAMRWMLKMDRNPTLLMASADVGNIQIARYLIQAGAKKTPRTRTPGMWAINFAANRGDVRMMRLLLGQDPYHEDRIIEISLSQQKAVMFDHEGKEIFKTKVSTGKRGFSTPAGEYVITNKHRDWTSTLYHASMPYFQRLSCADFGMHQGVVPDYPASHGCIRVPAANASKLFGVTQVGDRVRILK